MRTAFTLLFAVVGAASIAAQSSTRAPKEISLSGCVERDDKKPDEYLLTDAKAKKTYRLTGTDVREFVGRRVQIDGGLVVKGLKISGGLQPNPNIAAQAGAIDPGRAAVQAATTPKGTATTTETPEFKVKAIRPAGGPCQ